MDIQQLIPLPEAVDFQTQIGTKRQAERKGRVERHDLRYSFWEGLLASAKDLNPVHANRSPSNGTWTAGSIGRAGFSINYGLRQRDNSVYLWIDNDKAAFDALMEQKVAIEAEFGHPLIWEEKGDQLGRSIIFRQAGGYRSDPEERSGIQRQMIEAMLKLDEVMRGRVQALRT